MAGTPPLYWAPDKDPSWLVNPGVLTEVHNMVPRTSGTLASYACTPGERFTRVTPFAKDTCPVSAAILQSASTTAGSQNARMIIGNHMAGGLLEVLNTTMVDLSRVGAAYGDIREWQFSGYGNGVLATPGAPHLVINRPTEYPQFSTDRSVVFVNLPGGTIKGCCITVQKGFIVLGNVYDGVTWFGDGWACSGLNNSGSWVVDLSSLANLATQANYGRILDAPGQIRAMVNMRDGIVAYKPDAMFLGRYTGNPFTWSWSLASDGVGSASGNNVVSVNGMHYFLHRTGVYMFDGSVPRNIGDGKVNEFLSRKMQGEFNYTLPGPKGVVDDRRNLIFWFVQTNEFQKNTVAYLNAAFVLNYLTGACGWIDDPWSDNTFAGVAFGRGFGCPIMASQEDLQLWNGAVAHQLNQSIMTTGNIGGEIQLRMPVIDMPSLQENTTSSIVTGDLGDEVAFTLIRGIKPRLIRGDTDAQTAMCTVDGKPSQADYFDDEGFLAQAIASSAGSGFVIVDMAVNDGVGIGMVPYTVQAGDHVAFEYKRRLGPSVVRLAVRLTDSAAVAYDFLSTTIGLNLWGAMRTPVPAPGVGKSLVRVSAFFDTGGIESVAGELYQNLVRNIRITDVNGVVRRRLWNASEERVAYTVTMAPTVSGVWANPSNILGGVKSIGVPFTYDVTRRRFQGAVSNRFHRARITFYNQTEIAALDLDMVPSGTE